MSKVHAIDAGDEGGGHKDYGHDRKDLDDLVLLNIDKTEECVLQVLKALRAELGVLQKGRDVAYKN